MAEPLKNLIFLAILAVALLTYVLPTIIAFRRRHHYRWVIFAINLVSGLSGIGYFIAFAWAIWPSKTGLADPFLNDPTSNSRESNQAIYGRYGANARAFDAAKTGKEVAIYRNDQQHGPFSIPEVQTLLATGQISHSDWAWSEGATAWVPLSSLADLAAVLPPPPPPYSSHP